MVAVWAGDEPEVDVDVGCCAPLPAVFACPIDCGGPSAGGLAAADDMPRHEAPLSRSGLTFREVRREIAMTMSEEFEGLGAGGGGSCKWTGVTRVTVVQVQVQVQVQGTHFWYIPCTFLSYQIFVFMRMNARYLTKLCTGIRADP
jgi:hypothetical protein